METKKNTTQKKSSTPKSSTKSGSMPKASSRNISESTREKLRDHAENERRDDQGRFEAGSNRNSRSDSQHRSHNDSSMNQPQNRREDDNGDAWVIIESSSCEW